MIKRIIKASLAALSIGIVFLIILPFAFVKLGEALNLPEVPSSKIIGTLLFLIGILIFFHCSYLFIKKGKGTPAPMHPPQKLVPDNIYKYTRNPMYIGYLSMIFGEVFLFGRLSLTIYAAIMIFTIHSYVVLFEEPKLEKRFGESYKDYKRKIPRWI